MMVNTALAPKPIIRLSLSRPSKINSPKPIPFHQFSASKSVFLGGFGSTKAASKTMTELVQISAFRSGNSDENIGVFPQEAFVDETNGFRDGFMAHGVETTLNRMSKWLTAALFGGIILWRRDAEALWAAMGAVVNSILSVMLKRIFNQARPVSGLKSDPGMPSSHSQSFFFAVTFAILLTVQCLGINEFTLILSAVGFTLASYFSWLRVSLQFHTISQVVVGAAVGSIYSIFWYWLWNAYVLNAFISSLLVRVAVVLGAAAFCLCFLVYMIRHWLNDE